MSNPHYKPELQVEFLHKKLQSLFKAQTTLVNFTVTRTGLEDQLLAEVVKADRPDLEDQKAALTRQQNEYKILLKVRLDTNKDTGFKIQGLEDDLLQRLNAAGDNILRSLISYFPTLFSNPQRLNVGGEP